MTTVLVYRDGAVREAEAVDPAWLRPGAPEVVWVDIEIARTRPTGSCSADTFHFHELAVEDAVARAASSENRSLRRHALPDPARHRGRQEAPGIRDPRHRFLPRPQLPRHRPPPSVAIDRGEQEVLQRHGALLGEGACSLLHRIVDRHGRPLRAGSGRARGSARRARATRCSTRAEAQSASRHPAAEIGHCVAAARHAAAA